MSSDSPHKILSQITNRLISDLSFYGLQTYNVMETYISSATNEIRIKYDRKFPDLTNEQFENTIKVIIKQFCNNFTVTSRDVETIDRFTNFDYHSGELAIHYVCSVTNEQKTFSIKYSYHTASSLTQIDVYLDTNLIEFIRW